MNIPHHLREMLAIIGCILALVIIVGGAILYLLRVHESRLGNDGSDDKNGKDAKPKKSFLKALVGLLSKKKKDDGHGKKDDKKDDHGKDKGHGGGHGGHGGGPKGPVSAFFTIAGAILLLSISACTLQQVWDSRTNMLLMSQALTPSTPATPLKVVYPSAGTEGSTGLQDVVKLYHLKFGKKVQTETGTQECRVENGKIAIIAVLAPAGTPGDTMLLPLDGKGISHWSTDPLEGKIKACATSTMTWPTPVCITPQEPNPNAQTDSLTIKNLTASPVPFGCTYMVPTEPTVPSSLPDDED